ncbi:hypothetical protein AVEN_262348-1, partial [Araneus ventricosus]
MVAEDETKMLQRKRRICTCPSKKRRMTKYMSNYCNQVICEEHNFKRLPRMQTLLFTT